LAQPPVPHDSTSRDQTSLSPPKSKLMDYYKNAKLEDIICQPITPAYDGLADEFVSFMNHLDLHRQDEAWAPAIYLTHNGNTCNLLKQFVNITEESMTTMALHIGTPPQ
jgi:hypothetical protein